MVDEKRKATRLLISTGLVTGAVALAGGFSAPAIALFGLKEEKNLLSRPE